MIDFCFICLFVEVGCHGTNEDENENEHESVTRQDMAGQGRVG